MRIELSETQMTEIFEAVKAQMIEAGIERAQREVGLYMQNGQFIGEVRNLVAQSLIKDLKTQALKNISESKIIEKSLKAVEDRINHTVHAQMMKGVKVSIHLGGEK